VRAPLIVSVLALSLVPLSAQAKDYNEPALGEAAEELSDPVRQEQVGAIAGAMIEAVMRMPVGPMLRAAAEMGGEDPDGIDPETTVADKVGDRAADAPREVAEKLPQMMGMMASMAGVLDGMIPQLREMAQTMRRELPQDE
jgi:hypothetical protein